MSPKKEQAPLPKLVLVDSVLPDRKLKIASAEQIVNGTCRSRRFNEVPAKILAKVGKETLDGMYCNAVKIGALSNASLEHIRNASQLARLIGATAPGSRIDAEFSKGREVFALVRRRLTLGRILRIRDSYIVLEMRTGEKIRAEKQSDLFFFASECETIARFPYWTKWAFPRLGKTLAEKARS